MYHIPIRTLDENQSRSMNVVLPRLFVDEIKQCASDNFLDVSRFPMWIEEFMKMKSMLKCIIKIRQRPETFLKPVFEVSCFLRKVGYWCVQVGLFEGKIRTRLWVKDEETSKWVVKETVSNSALLANKNYEALEIGFGEKPNSKDFLVVRTDKLGSTSSISATNLAKLFA